MMRTAQISRAFSVCGWADCEAGVAPRLPSLRIVLGHGALKFYASRPMMDLNRRLVRQASALPKIEEGNSKCPLQESRVAAFSNF